MHLRMIGLGRMGSNPVRRLMRDGHRCVAYERNQDVVKALEAEGLALRIFGRYGPLANTNSCLDDVVRWITDEAKPVLQAGSACSAADCP
jgi:NAD binding domain of 6-phosphogluconate dehydrogenase